MLIEWTVGHYVERKWSVKKLSARLAFAKWLCVCVSPFSFPRRGPCHTAVCRVLHLHTHTKTAPQDRDTALRCVPRLWHAARFYSNKEYSGQWEEFRDMGAAMVTIHLKTESQRHVQLNVSDFRNCIGPFRDLDLSVQEGFT